MEKLCSRNFNVDYFEKEKNLWSLVSSLKDDIHEIKVELDISVPSMVIKDANVDFIQYPVDGCLLVKSKIKKLIGLCLYDNFIGQVGKIFLGCKGCPNIMNLISISAPAVIYFYNVGLIKKGQMTDDEWWGFVAEELPDACIVHKQISEIYKRQA